MKNKFLYIIIGSLLLGATFLMLKNNKKRSDNMKLLYENNVKILEKYLTYLEDGNIDSLTNLLSEEYLMYRYPVMESKGLISNKKEIIQEYEKKFEGAKIDIGHTIFLPGIDTINLNLDGSVRVYSAQSWTISNKVINMSIYETYDFKNDSIYQTHIFYDHSRFKEIFEKYYYPKEESGF